MIRGQEKDFSHLLLCSNKDLLSLSLLDPMSTFIVLLFIFLVGSDVSRACHIAFDQVDSADTIRHIYERDIFNITGELHHCPPSILVHNISISNPQLKRLSILNVSYFIENNQINITALGRLVGFAPLKIQLYFQDQFEQR